MSLSIDHTPLFKYPCAHASAAQGELACLHFDGGLATLAQRPCNASDAAQQWLYDEASLVFRHASNAQRCIDFFVAHRAFGAWSCRDNQEVNTQQQFRYEEAHERFCLLSDRSKCLQEATSSLLY